MRSIRTTVLALTSAFALLVTFPAFASHWWGGYHWPVADPSRSSSNQFNVTLVDDLSSTSYANWPSILGSPSAANTVANDWSKGGTNGADVLDTPVEAASTHDPSNCPAIYQKVRVCNASYGATGWLGVAQIWIYNGTKHIAQGTVKVNDYYFTASYSGGKYANSSEERHVLCQEVGHTFGLDHQDTSGVSVGTCMDYYHNTSDSDTLSISPNQHDYDQLLCMYKSHTDPNGKPSGCGLRGHGRGQSNSERVSERREGQYTVVTFHLLAA